MVKTNLRKIITMLAIILLMVSITSSVFALGSGENDPLAIPGANTDVAGASGVNSITGNILGIIQAVAMGVAVVMLVVLAIKYFSASAEGKAEVKKQAMAYVIGAVLLFGGTAILGILRSVGETMATANIVTSTERVEIIRTTDINA